MTTPWYALANADTIDSPALVVYPDRVERNIAAMIRIAGGPQRLRPHVKTYKISQIIVAQLAHGIRKFKAATIAEAELAALAGAEDVLLAYQPVGPKIERLLALVRAFPKVRFSALVDNMGTVGAVAGAFAAAGLSLPLFIDLNVGMNRTGIAPGDAALAIYARLAVAPGVASAGFHVYDGHIHDTDLDRRSDRCAAAFAPVTALLARVQAEGLPSPTVIAGGTPTLPLHATLHPDVELSPGTSLLWDWGYRTECPDLPFDLSAALLCRIVSKPADALLCVDLGTKALASEMMQPRAVFPDVPDAKIVAHNEEHLVFSSASASQWSVGDVLYAIPWHICPTVNLHAEVIVARDGQAQERWPVSGRARRLSV